MSFHQWWDRFREYFPGKGPRDLTLDEFVDMMGQWERPGPLGRFLMRRLFRDEAIIDVEHQKSLMTAIYDSMNRRERADVGILNGSRRRRIAEGAGVRTPEVAQFVKQFVMTRDMMRALRGR
jgi:signal recognition particle subunit SRP54